jgi:hypothetical protein
VSVIYLCASTSFAIYVIFFHGVKMSAFLCFVYHIHNFFCCSHGVTISYRMLGKLQIPKLSCVDCFNLIMYIYCKYKPTVYKIKWAENNKSRSKVGNWNRVNLTLQNMREKQEPHYPVHKAGCLPYLLTARRPGWVTQQKRLTNRLTSRYIINSKCPTGDKTYYPAFCS